MAIGQTLQADGFTQRTFWARAENVGRASTWLVNELDSNGDEKHDPIHTNRRGKIDKLRSIRIYGHSWGALTAVRLAESIEHDVWMAKKDVDVLALIDPVNKFRGDFVPVPANVNIFRNGYRTFGGDITIPILDYLPVGSVLQTVAKDSLQLNLNDGNPMRYVSPNVEIDRFNIIDVVVLKFDRIRLLEEGLA